MMMTRTMTAMTNKITTVTTTATMTTKMTTKTMLYIYIFFLIFLVLAVHSAHLKRLSCLPYVVSGNLDYLGHFRTLIYKSKTDIQQIWKLEQSKSLAFFLQILALSSVFNINIINNLELTASSRMHFPCICALSQFLWASVQCEPNQG